LSIKKLFYLVFLFVFLGCGDSSVSTDENSSTLAQKREIEVYFSQTRGSFNGGVDEIIVSDIQNAKKSIYLAIYDLTNDKFRDALIEAYANGVDVVVMTDDDHVNDEDMLSLKDAGIPVYDDSKSALMHNKFLIIDKNILWSGSTNYTYYAFYRNHENAIKIVDKEVALFYKEEFDELISKHREPGIYDKDGLEVYFSPEDHFKDRLIALINSAKSSIYFMIYAFTDKDVADALINAQKRGVEVKGVFDKDFNSNPYSKYDYLKEAGLDVRLDGASFLLHDKVMIFDQNTVVTGSYNFTLSANNKNAENSLVIEDKEIYKKYEDEFWKIYNEGK